MEASVSRNCGWLGWAVGMQAELYIVSVIVFFTGYELNRNGLHHPNVPHSSVRRYHKLRHYYHDHLRHPTRSPLGIDIPEDAFALVYGPFQWMASCQLTSVLELSQFKVRAADHTSGVR